MNAGELSSAVLSFASSLLQLLEALSLIIYEMKNRDRAFDRLIITDL